MEVEPPAAAAAPLDAAAVETAARAALVHLGTAVTLKQLRLHLEGQLGVQLIAWRQAIKAAASAFAIEQAGM